MERLTGLDAGFLYAETPSAHMHVAAFAIFDPRESVEPLTRELVLELVEERLHLVPMMRRRLAEVPLQLHHPVWVDDPDFDIEKHVKWLGVKAPGGRQELAEAVAAETSRPLDRSRPLWELVIFEGLEDGMMASLTKTHHAAIDGVAGVEMSMALLDLQPEPTRYEPPPWEPEEMPSDLELVGYGLASRARQPFGMVRAARAMIRNAQESQGRDPGPSRAQKAVPAPFSAPATPLNGALTPHRTVSFGQLALADIKAIKNSLGGTVNDVVLAICSSILRAYFDEMGEDVDEDLVAMVPISVRTEDEKDQLGNRVSSMLVRLANTVDDPVERLRAISDETRDAKEQHNAIGADTMGNWAEFAPPRLTALSARLYSQLRLADRHRPAYNVTISNVPGVPFPLYSFGAKMQSTYPMGPLQDGMGLNITVTSYLDQMFFGFHGCRELLEDPWFLVERLDDALAELAGPAGVQTTSASNAESPAAATKRAPAKKKAAKKKATKKRAPAKKKATKKKAPARKKATKTRAPAKKKTTKKKASTRKRAAKKSSGTR